MVRAAALFFSRAQRSPGARRDPGRAELISRSVLSGPRPAQFNQRAPSIENKNMSFERCVSHTDHKTLLSSGTRHVVVVIMREEPRASAASCQFVPPSLADLALVVRCKHMRRSCSRGRPIVGPVLRRVVVLAACDERREHRHARIARLRHLQIFFVAALFVYGPRLSPFFTPEPGGDRRGPS